MTKNRQIIDFEVIWKKIHTSLSEEEEEALNNWLSESVENRHYFDQVKSQYSKGKPEFPIPNSAIGWNELNRKLKRKRTPVMRYVSGIAASLIIAIGLYWFWPRYVNTSTKQVEIAQTIPAGANKAILITEEGSTYEISSDTNLDLSLTGINVQMEGGSLKYGKGQPSTTQKSHILKVPRGGEFYLTLSDNTKVWLNAETTLKYPVTFSDDIREVELEGEAYFEVTKNESSPFRVISTDQTVQVLGTSFNISCYPSDDEILTTLVEGSVNVFKTGLPEMGETLLPFHQSVYSKSTRDLTQRKVDVKEFIAWKDGDFLFKDQSLFKMMETLSRWYDVEVSYLNEEVKNIRFNGNIKRYEDLNKVLELIEKTNEVKFIIEEKVVKVK